MVHLPIQPSESVLIPLLLIPLVLHSYTVLGLGVYFSYLCYIIKTSFYYYQQNYLANGLHLRLI